MIKYCYNLKRTLDSSLFYILCLLFITYLSIKLFTNLLDFNTTIYCLDNNNNQGWRNIRIGTDLGTLFDIGVNGAVTPIPVRVGVFAVTYTIIYAGRRAFGADPIINLNLFVGNNNGGNRFNSPLESGEALDNINTFVESIMIINLATLVAFNLLVFILANRAIIPYIIKWLETKLNTNNIIYRVIERTYRANMKITI